MRFAAPALLIALVSGPACAQSFVPTERAAIDLVRDRRTAGFTTVARTLAVLVFEFRGYQNQFEHTLPGPDEVPLFAEHDSLYRWLLKGTAVRPEDRFGSAEETRDQLLGVLRDVTAKVSARAITRSTPSRMFETPAVADDQLEWHDLPALAVDPTDPSAAWLAGVTADEPAGRMHDHRFEAAAIAARQRLQQAQRPLVPVVDETGARGATAEAQIQARVPSPGLPGRRVRLPAGRRERKSVTRWRHCFLHEGERERTVSCPHCSASTCAEP